MPINRHELATQGDATPTASIFFSQDGSIYRLSFLAAADQEAGGMKLGYAAALTKEQVSALAGMLSAVLDGADPQAVAIHHL